MTPSAAAFLFCTPWHSELLFDLCKQFREGKTVQRAGRIDFFTVSSACLPLCVCVCVQMCIKDGMRKMQQAAQQRHAAQQLLAPAARHPAALQIAVGRSTGPSQATTGINVGPLQGGTERAIEETSQQPPMAPASHLLGVLLLPVCHTCITLDTRFSCTPVIC